MIVMRHSPELVNGLKQLIEENLKQDSRVLEVGAFLGESTRMFLESGKVLSMYVVDAWQNDLDIHDYTTNLYDLSEIEQQFDQNVAEFPQVVKVKGNSLVVCDELPDSFFDLVYLDSCHEYNHVASEIGQYIRKVAKGGVIAGHDYDAAFGGVMEAVDYWFGKPDKIYEDSSWVKYL